MAKSEYVCTEIVLIDFHLLLFLFIFLRCDWLTLYLVFSCSNANRKLANESFEKKRQQQYNDRRTHWSTM